MTSRVLNYINNTDLDGVPSVEEILDRARAISDCLQSRGSNADAAKNVPAETVQEMMEAGLFRVLQPRCWSGFEMHPNVFFEIQMILAEGCMSTGWIYGVIGVHPFQLALFDEQAQKDVWDTDDSTLVSSSYQPVAKVQKADGGYRISGRWSFSSGSLHCKWALLGGIVPADVSASGHPEMRTFLLPRKDYEIIENWDVLGLKATGSHDVLVEDVFVPEYRTHNATDGFMCNSPGNQLNQGHLYRIPWAQIFVRAVSTAAIGAAQGALNEYVKIAKTRMPSFAEKGTVHDPVAQSLVADARTKISGLRSTLFNNIDHLYTAAADKQEIELEDRIQYRYDSAIVVEECIELVNRMQHNLGGRGIYNNSPVVRYFLDLHAARAHVANTPSKFAFNLGAVSLGLENKDFFV